MMRFWLGLWLLAGSWLFGLDYFFAATTGVWMALVALGTLMVCLSAAAPPTAAGAGRDTAGGVEGTGRARTNAATVVMTLALAPAVVLLPWPFRLGPALMMAGALLEGTPARAAWWGRASRGLTLSGVMLLAQALALSAYKHGTARSHDLPWPLPEALAGFIRLLGVEAAADGADLVLPTMRVNHRLGATWELLLDPATICFLAGALAVCALACFGREDAAPAATVHSGRRQRGGSDTRARVQLPARIKAAGVLLLAVGVWLPLRVGLHVGVFLHRALRTDYEAPLNLMNQFWSPWPALLLLLLLALLAGWWGRGFIVSVFHAAANLPWRADRRQALGIGLSFASAVALTLAVHWDPIGRRQPGRVAVDEFHSKWEPTDRPFDTEWYGHLSGYNYACLYDFCSHYYAMSRLTNAWTDAALAHLDVLILKVPTEPILPGEVDALARFVERGGGVLMIGEHTDVFNTGYHLNSVARRFGFTFRYDCLFGMESFFDQYCALPARRHPALQNALDFDFATSCSIAPGRSAGRGVIVSTGLKNAMADYHANNYYPQAVDHAAMRAGAFVQLWAARHGRGRVLAFTDSTIFSNFSTFEPGKIELFLGMLEWLNRRDGVGNPRPWLLLLGAALLVATVAQAWRAPGARRWMLAAGILGWSAAGLGLTGWQRRALPQPQPHRNPTWVTIDRTVCDGPLSKGGFIAGKPDGFGIFERWLLRLGYFTRRVSGLEALRGDLVVFFQPTKVVSPAFREAAARYVEGGGRLLVLDSSKNERSTAATLLEPFGLSMKPLAGQSGTLTNGAGWPTVPAEGAREVVGGRTLFTWNGRPVGAVATRGRGTVVALGFGSRFSDPQMGVTGDVVPDVELRKVFDLQFALVRSLMQDRLGTNVTTANQRTQ